MCIPLSANPPSNTTAQVIEGGKYAVAMDSADGKYKGKGLPVTHFWGMKGLVPLGRNATISNLMSPSSSSGISAPSPQQIPNEVLYDKRQQVTGNPWRGSQGSVVRR
jgi:hypothetical protein